VVRRFAARPVGEEQALHAFCAQDHQESSSRRWSCPRPDLRYVDNFLTTNRKVCTIPESLGEVLDFFPVTL